MKFRHLLLLLLWKIVLSSGLHAQSYEWVKTAKLGNDLRALCFLDSLHGWAAGTTAAIYKTADGGETWTPYLGTSAMAIYGISFSDTLNGWCVGTDGSRGRIIHSSDGGKSWQQQFEKSDWYFEATHAFSASKNITVGYSWAGPGHQNRGVVNQTIDGGKTWTNISPVDSNQSYYHIQFLDTLNGVIWGYPALRTRDGGGSWTMLPVINQIQAVTFLDTLQAWGGYSHFMYHTTDGGQSWTKQADISLPSKELYFNTICFIDSLKGWAFGEMPYFGISSEGIFRTTDGGWHWQLESTGLTDDFDGLVDAKMFNDHNGIALSSFGNVLRYKLATSAPRSDAASLQAMPQEIMLHQNYPNPFNPLTRIEYELSRPETVSLEVTNALGEHVITLIKDTPQTSGRHSVEFDGSGLSSGTYFYTLRTSSHTETKTMTLVK